MHPLNLFKNFMPSRIIIIFEQSLLFPLFEYCDIVYNDLSINLVNRLQKIQNGFVRFIFNDKKYDHVSCKLHWHG